MAIFLVYLPNGGVPNGCFSRLLPNGGGA